jgi:hypothetical protein
MQTRKLTDAQYCFKASQLPSYRSLALAAAYVKDNYTTKM